MDIWKNFRNNPLGKRIRAFVPQSVVNTFFHFPLALLAVLFYRYPARKLKVIGVTGTDGKTTTVNLINRILKEAGLRTAMISTVGAEIDDKKIATGLHVTAPNPWLLQKLLRKMVDKGIKYVVLEATSHGLDQHRLLGCNFAIGVMTNVTHEHLDYHQTQEKYLAAKARLFKGVKIVVLNRDDKSYEYLFSKLPRKAGYRFAGQTPNSELVTYGIKRKADFTPSLFQLKTSLPGEHNQYNCLAAAIVATTLGVSREKIKQGLACFEGVSGRMEEIKEGQDFKVFVDFAHTPNALEQTLTQLRKELPLDSARGENKLILVFGCAGFRDRAKRPMMGKIAAQYADLTILTTEDPRTENINQIIDEIAQGCLVGGAKELTKGSRFKVRGSRLKYFFRISDRQEAISFAIQKLARKGDIVVICGKGHEKSMCCGETESPWSDQEAARKALKS